ncbi:MAG: hypothetical protein KJS68_13600, partial [Alphaproteobacteria bacterium]|nr:hypothetical protein [Alphaproteobacteria bacterium]
IAISIKHSIQMWEWQTLVSTTGRNDKLPHTIASANQVGGDGTRRDAPNGDAGNGSHRGHAENTLVLQTDSAAMSDPNSPNAFESARADANGATSVVMQSCTTPCDAELSAMPESQYTFCQKKCRRRL